MKLTKKRYLIGFVVVVILLACIRLAFPSVAQPKSSDEPMVSEAETPVAQ